MLRNLQWLTAIVLTLLLAGCVISPRRPDPNAVTNPAPTPTPTPTPTPPPATPVGKLYVSNETANSIVRFDNALAAATTGNIAPAATMSGASTLLDKPSFLLVDTAADRLYVSNPSTPTGTQSILVFDSISTKTGNVAPSRVISGAATTLTSPADMALDKAKDELYVADGLDILVFKPASSSSGNVAPARTLTTAFGIGAILLDPAKDILYLADPSTNTINVYDGASTLVTGTITPNRSITGAATGLNQPSGLRLDGTGRLVVSNFSAPPTPPSITIYGTPSTATGNVTPAATISGASTALTGPTQSAFNPAGSGELYVVDFAGKVLGYSNFASATGNLAPTRNISGANTGLGGATVSAPTARGVALDPTH